jgi:chromosome segregation ATPase
MDEEYKQEQKIFEENIEEKKEEHQELQEEIKEVIEEAKEEDDIAAVKATYNKMMKALADKIAEYQKSELEYEKTKLDYDHKLKKSTMEIELLKEDNETLAKENVKLRGATGKYKLTEPVLYFASLLEDFEANTSDPEAKERMMDFYIRGLQFAEPSINPMDEKKRFAEMRKAAILASTGGSGTSHVQSKLEPKRDEIPLGWKQVKKAR